MVNFHTTFASVYLGLKLYHGNMCKMLMVNTNMSDCLIDLGLNNEKNTLRCHDMQPRRQNTLVAAVHASW